jgi:hypothetical protein
MASVRPHLVHDITDNGMNRLLPKSLAPRLSALLPSEPTHFAGPTLASALTVLYLSLITVRSLLHLLLPDGGAHGIATIDTSGAAGANIIAIFGQWGAIQLLLAALLWVLIIRYPGFIPLTLLVFALEPVLRGLAGHLKPIVTVGTAPGVALNWVVVPWLLLTLWLSLCPVHLRP